MKNDAVKAAANSHWPEIIGNIGGVERKYLDGKHHLCPKCGGTDRFRVFDDFPKTGGAICDRFGSGKNGGNGRRFYGSHLDSRLGFWRTGPEGCPMVK